MGEDYKEIEKLTTNQNAMLDKSLQQQNDIINKQTEMNVAELDRNKQEVDAEANKVNKNLYAEYQKASNSYGTNAENLYSNGLGNSGYAESSKVNLYNTYQKNVTDTINNAQKLKSDFDFQISQARKTGDITLAQNALAIYNQKMQLLTQEYELKNNREQFLYQKSQDALAQSNWEKQFAETQNQNRIANNQWQQSFDYQKGRDAVNDNQWQQNFDYQKERDAVSDNQWQKTYDYNKSINDRDYNYQISRDKVSDNQWEKEYELSKKASARSSSSRSRSSSGRRSYGSSSNSNNSNVVAISPADNVSLADKTQSLSQNASGGIESPTIISSALSMIATGIMNSTSPNSNERKVQLQKLVDGGALTQDEANKLLSA